MVPILVMLNNYMHDFATALVVVCSFIMMTMIKYADRNGGAESKRMVAGIYPRMLHLAAGSFIFLILAGVIRSFTYREYEWMEAAGRGQVAALAIKHVLLFVLFGYGIYLWVRVHRRVRAIRKELKGAELP